MGLSAQDVNFIFTEREVKTTNELYETIDK